MSNHDDIIETSRSFRLRMDILGLMLKGASYAALLVIGIWLFVYVIYLIGLALPEDSKQASDPTPVSYYSAPAASLPVVYDL